MNIVIPREDSSVKVSKYSHKLVNSNYWSHVIFVLQSSE